MLRYDTDHYSPSSSVPLLKSGQDAVAFLQRGKLRIRKVQVKSTASESDGVLQALPVSQTLHCAAPFGHFGQLLFRLKQQGSRQHFVAVEESDPPAGKPLETVHLVQLHEQHQRFAKVWDNNLRLQGYAEAFDPQKHVRG